jgi:uncharacterized protein
VFLLYKADYLECNFVNPEKKVDLFIRDVFKESEHGAHTYDHTKRVYVLAIKIGKQLDANLRILGMAALLHDVGRLNEIETGISHAIQSGEMSKHILEELGFDESEIEQVIQAIRTHRFSENLQPSSLEGKILSDADKLDAMGAIGVYRAIAQATTTGVGINGFLKHADEKLLKLYDLMHTRLAKKEATKRHEVLSVFVQQLISEKIIENNY